MMKQRNAAIMSKISILSAADRYGKQDKDIGSDGKKNPHLY